MLHLHVLAEVLVLLHLVCRLMGNFTFLQTFLSLCHMQIAIPFVPERLHRMKELKMSPTLVQICLLVAGNGIVDINLRLRDS